MVRGQPVTGGHSRVCSQKARQKGTPILNHPIQNYLTPSHLHSIPVLVSTPRSRLCAFCRDGYSPRNHHKQL